MSTKTFPSTGSKPKFDPNVSYEAVEQEPVPKGKKPAFNPNAKFEAVTMEVPPEQPKSAPQQPAFKPMTDWLNIPQQEHQPMAVENAVPIDDHTIKTSQASQRVQNHLGDIDNSIHNLIYDKKKDVKGRLVSQQLGLNPSESGPINPQAQQLESKLRQDIPVAPQEVEEFKVGMNENPVMLRQGLAQKAKDLTKVNPTEASKLKGDIYRLDRQANPEKEQNISQNIDKINSGEYDYDIVNGRLIKPLGFFGSVANAFKEKGKAYDDYDVYQSGDEKKIMDRIRQRLNDDPDKATPIPIGELGEAGAMLGGQPLKPLIGGAIAGVFTEGLGAPAAAAAISAPEMYKLTFGSALPGNYAALKKQNPELPDSEVLQKAIDLTDKQANTDALSGAAMGAIGAKAALKPAASALLQKSVKSALKQIGETVAIEGIGGGAIGAGGQLVKNLMAQKAGIPVDESEGMAQQLVGGAFMTLGVAVAGRMGALLKPSTYNKLLHGLSKLPEEAISSELAKAQEVGALTPEQAQKVQNDISEQKKIDASIRGDVPESDRVKIAEKIKETAALDKELETAHKAYHPEIKEQIKKLDEDIVNTSKGSERGELQKLVDREHKSGKIEGFVTEALRDATEKELQGYFKEISEQAHDPNSEAITIATFGEDIVNKAKELYPQEVPKESKISVIQPGEIKHPETITIKPQENESLRERIPEAAAMDETSGSSPEMGQRVPEPGEATNAQEGQRPPQEESAPGGQEGIGGGKGGPPAGKVVNMADYGEGGKELDKLANNIPDSGKVAEYMSKETIEKYTGETPANDQSRGVQELEIALNHGEKIIEKAKQIFGKDYAEKTIEYIDNSTAGVSNKALMYVSLENALGREKLENPTRAAEITKQQALVYAKSQAFARENSLALNYQKLRRIAKVGYDIDKVTESFFSPEEREGRKNISKAIEADPDMINKQAEAVETGKIAPDVEKAIKEGVAKEIENIYNKLPKEKKTIADKAIAALDKIHDKLRGKTYESTLGIPIAIIDGGVLTIRNAIKAGVKIADAVEMGIAKIKEKYKDWAKEDEFRKDVISGLREQGIEDTPIAKTRQERLAEAEGSLQKRIDAIREEIITGEREAKNKRDKLQSKKLDQLKEQKKTLEAFRDKYLPKGDDPYTNEKTAKTIETKLINENIELNRQIAKGEKDRVENKVTIESESIDKLKAERDVRKEILEVLDPTPKDYVKNALIQQGLGREKVIKGEKKQILDWKKLAGAAGTVSKISENVGKVLESDGFSESQLERIKDSFIQEYVDLRASVIEKAQNELAKRNKETVTQEQKSAAKKLAELYTYGLFDSQPDVFENILNKALGSKVSEKGFNEAREIAKGMETLYSSSFQGVKLNDISAKAAIEQLENKMRLLLVRETKGQGNYNFRAANIVRNYFDLQQTMVLNNLKQAVENPLSGFQQELIEKIGGMIGKERIGTPEMGAQRRALMKDIYKDMVLNGSIGYGKTETAFVNRTHVDDHINKLSDGKLYHGVMSVLSGKATLNAADAMYKASITEKKFATNLIKILTNETNPNRMSPGDAINFVSEKLTGQTLKDAKVSAREIIEKINKDAGRELIPTTPESINRFANDIVKSALEMGNQITTEQITAAYNAAYKAAGLGLGHEANNILSSTVSGYTAKLESRINDAIKDKEWNRAAVLTAQSILFRNVLNPFVGGGTNWLVLKFEKTGLGLVTGLGYKIGSNTKIDLSTEVGMKTLEKRLYNQARVKDNYMRGLVGGAASALTYLAFTGLANTDEYRKWRGRNAWAARYLDIITPEMLLIQMAVENKAVKKYISGTLNRNESFDATAKLIKAGEYAVKGDNDMAMGAIGEALGAKLNIPLPWRLVKDGQVIYQGIKGQDPYHGNYAPSIGFLNGVFQGGAIEWVGLRPEANESNGASGSSGKPGKPGKPSKPGKPTK